MNFFNRLLGPFAFKKAMNSPSPSLQARPMNPENIQHSKSNAERIAHKQERYPIGNFKAEGLIHRSRGQRPRLRASPMSSALKGHPKGTICRRPAAVIEDIVKEQAGGLDRPFRASSTSGPVPRALPSATMAVAFQARGGVDVLVCWFKGTICASFDVRHSRLDVRCSLFNAEGSSTPD